MIDRIHIMHLGWFNRYDHETWEEAIERRTDLDAETRETVLYTIRALEEIQQSSEWKAKHKPRDRESFKFSDN